MYKYSVCAGNTSSQLSNYGWRWAIGYLFQYSINTFPQGVVIFDTLTYFTDFLLREENNRVVYLCYIKTSIKNIFINYKFLLVN